MPALKALSVQGRLRTPLPSLHDVELAMLAAAGDRAAFGELVRRHSSDVRGLMRRMGADPELADELAQNAFLAAFEGIAEFRGEGAFSGWIRRIAARLYIRCWRQRSHLDPALDDQGLADPETLGEEDATFGRPDLDQALGALSAAERLCVGLCYGVGLSHLEAAEALKAPLGTVKSHVKRGFEKLKRQLDPVGLTHDNARSRPLG